MCFIFWKGEAITMKKRYLKIMSVMLCAAMCSSLAACGSGDSSEGSSDSSTESSSSSDSGKKKGLEIAISLFLKALSMISQKKQELT